MALRQLKLGLLAFTGTLFAHPMGNFSVNHYAHLDVRTGEVRITYVLDLAEIPTFELLRKWNADAKNQARLAECAAAEAREWIANLSVIDAGRRMPVEMLSVAPQLTDGAGGMPVLRVAVGARANLMTGGKVIFEDQNYLGRAGWKEIVLVREGRSTPDLSAALTSYPTDPGIAPPQVTKAEFEWSPPAGPVPAPATAVAAPAVFASPAVSFSRQQPPAAGTVVAGDLLSRLLRHRDLTLGMLLLALAAAFGLGSIHALSPGHGKTIVAAYLVGSRGTWRHAGFLGLMVTFTHTASVFLLGLGVLFFQQYVVPEKILPALGVVSGFSIVAVGVYLLYQRVNAMSGAGHEHHGHDHDHERDHGHHDHHHHHHHHHHHEHHHRHSHVPEGKVTLGSLVALGISGGLVPCPSALVLMLSAIALGRPGLGLVLLIAFSAGLAVVLTAIGLLVVYGKRLLPHGPGMDRPAFRLIPVFSAVVVICLGLAMAAASAGWVRPLGIL